MLQRLRAARRNQNGFTLTELLIVIVILGVLAGIVVFAVAGITDRGTKSACQADVRTVQTAVEAYHAEKNAYPATITLLTDPTVKLLREVPNSTKYTVSLDSVTGKVTGTITGGGAC